MSPKIWNHSEWIPFTDAVLLKAELETMLLRSTFTIIGYTEHHFQPQGWTAVWVLGESHLAVHTFPESHTSYIELSSCIRSKYVLFLEELEHLLATQLAKAF